MLHKHKSRGLNQKTRVNGYERATIASRPKHNLGVSFVSKEKCSCDGLE